jgi:ABC-2 type transport system ATP-binding protein
MKQKVVWIAALIHNPRILFLDEPLNGLDVGAVLLVQDLIRSLSREGRIIFFCSHILEVVEKLCSRLIIISGGRKVADDSIANLTRLYTLPDLEAILKQLVREGQASYDPEMILEIVRS